MSFLFALSDAEQVKKQAKRDALVAALQEQVLERQAKKDAKIAAQKLTEEEELKSLAARGLDMWGRPLRQIDPQQRQLSARGNNNNINNPTIQQQYSNNQGGIKPNYTSSPKHHYHHQTNIVGNRGESFDQEQAGDGANRQFMGALSNMFGPSDQERQAKERAREKLKRDLAEQVARKKLERQRLADEQKRREEEELRENAAKGLDLWGRPLPPGKKVPQLNLQGGGGGHQKVGKYKSPRVRTSPRSSRNQQQMYDGNIDRPKTSPKTVVPKIDLSYNRVNNNDRYENNIGPEYEENESISTAAAVVLNSNHNEIDEDRMPSIPSNIDALTNLCHKLLKEQKALREIVEKREVLLDQKMSPMQSKKYERKRRPRNDNNNKANRRKKQMKPKTPPRKSNMPTRRRTTQEINSLNANLPFGRRLAARKAKRNENYKKKYEDENGMPIDYKLTKNQKEDAKKRRAAVRAEYANKNRKRNFSHARGPSNNLPNLDLNSRLDGKSKFVYDYDKKGATMMIEKDIPDSLSQAVEREVLKYAPKKKNITNNKNKKMKNNNHIPAPSTRIKNKIMKPPLPKQPARRRKKKKTKKPLPKFVFQEPEIL